MVFRGLVGFAIALPTLLLNFRGLVGFAIALPTLLLNFRGLVGFAIALPTLLLNFKIVIDLKTSQVWLNLKLGVNTNMKIPVIRANMGIWNYYLATLSFSEIARYVKGIDTELYEMNLKNETELTKITQIKEYLLSQDERLLSSLVLAVYDGEPKWIEVELHYKDEDFFNLGFLEFTGKEKIFPIQGQPQVEAIKAAFKENHNLSNEKVPVIFIGHQNTAEGIQRSQRLFSHLNKHVAPSIPPVVH
jgi:hypothetical protein